MLSFLRFLFSGRFWLNLFLMATCTVFFVCFAFWGMDWYTHHGESITVPDLKNFTVTKANNLLDSKDLRYTILDSTFVDNLPTGTIIEQNPKPGEKVKEKRRIYLTISSKTPPPVNVPNVVYASRRNAEEQLQSIGLNVGELEYIPDRAKDAVLSIKYNGKRYTREDLEKGLDVPKGSPITLVLGDGVGHTRIEVPALIGLSFLEAKLALRAWSLNQGHITRGTGITNNNIDRARVWKQYPEANSQQEITIGEPIDLWLTLGEVDPPMGAEEFVVPTPKPKEGDTGQKEEVIEEEVIEEEVVEEEVMEEEAVEKEVVAEEIAEEEVAEEEIVAEKMVAEKIVAEKVTEKTVPVFEADEYPIVEDNETAIVQPAPPPIRNIAPSKTNSTILTVDQVVANPPTITSPQPVSPPTITAQPNLTSPPPTQESVATSEEQPKTVESTPENSATTWKEQPKTVESTPENNATTWEEQPKIVETISSPITMPNPTPPPRPTGGFKVFIPKGPKITPPTPPSEKLPTITPTFKVIRPDTARFE